MREFLIDLLPWGVRAIVALQDALGSFLDPLFRAITMLGDVYLYLALLPLALWRGDKPRGMRLALLLLVSVYVNLVLKDVLAIPRPFVVSPAVQAKPTATGYAFPSGHAQGVTSLWVGLAAIYGARWAVPVGAAIIPIVAFSRVYLGVHYPQDAIGGVLVGLAVVGAYRVVEPPFCRWWRRLRVPARVAVTVIVPATMGALTPDWGARAMAGTILGLSLGRVIEVHRGGIVPVPGIRALARRTVVGAAVVALAYAVPDLAIATLTPLGVATSPPVTVGHFALVGLAVALLAPWVFVRLGLSLVAPPPAGSSSSAQRSVG